jgi:hypothetical protein
MLDYTILAFSLLLGFWASMLTGKETGVILKHLLIQKTLKDISSNLLVLANKAMQHHNDNVVHLVELKRSSITTMLSDSGGIIHSSASKITLNVFLLCTLLFILIQVS